MEKTVLIVEDEVLVGMILARNLEGSGFSVCEVVRTGEAAVVAARRCRPGVVLMDVSLGGAMDGIEAAARIKTELGIPIVLFSGYQQDEQLMTRAKEVEAFAVLDKLGPIENIVTALESAFN